MLTQAELKRELNYNQSTGEFRWNYYRGGRTETVGTVTNHGYLHIMLDRKRYLAHRLAWLYCYGHFPGELDHIDRDPLNNRVANLREVSHGENLINSKTRTDNTSGSRGVCWDKQKSKWKVQVTISPGYRMQKHFQTQQE